MILDAPTTGTLVDVPVDELHVSDDNPRSDLSDLDGLVASIHAAGIIEPLVVTYNSGGSKAGYTVVAGHRRLAAARLAGLATVPCVTRAFSSTAERVEVMAIENLQRSDLTPLDEARAMQMLVDLGRTQREIAERVGCNQSHVSRRLALLELDDDDADQLRSGTVTVREAEQKARPPKQVVEPRSLDADAIHELAKRMAVPPQIAVGGRSLDWAGYRIRLEARHGDPHVPLLVETIANVLRSEAAAFARSVRKKEREHVEQPSPAEASEPDDPHHDADAEPPGDTAPDHNFRAATICADAPAHALTKAPWGSYRVADTARIVSLVGELTNPERVRHTIAYEWSQADLRRDDVLAAAIARLDALEAD